MPGRAAIGIVTLRIGSAQPTGDGLLNQVMNNETITSALDERKRFQLIKSAVGWAVWQHNAEKRAGCPAHDRSGFKCCSCHWFTHVCQIKLRQFGNNMLAFDLFQHQVWML